ncbi:MAG: glycosyltransferase [Deltaproteobacteria bacterium]
MSQPHPPPPVVSVVVPAWRAEASIAGCLESLTRQQGAPPFEVVVVDSSPDQATGRAVAPFAREQGGGLDLHYLHLESRAFPGTARNRGVALARAPFLLFLDADVRAAPDLLGKAAEALARREVVVGGRIELGAARSVSARLRHIFEFKESMPGSPARPTWQLPSACLALPRSLFVAAGGFPDLRASEDWLFNWRLWESGTRMCFDPALRVVHETRAGWVEFLSYAGVLGHASGVVRRQAGLPGQAVVRWPLLAGLLPLARTGRALVWCARYARRDFLLLCWAWPAYLAVASVWAVAFRRGVLDLPATRPES